MRSRSKYWMITWFVPQNLQGTDSNEPPSESCKTFARENFESKCEATSIIQYACWQLEKCPNTSRFHLQAYVVYSGKQYGSAVKRHFCSEVHIELRRGNHIQAKEYCTKTESRVAGPWYYPNEGADSDLCTGQGQRTDILAAKSDIDAGKSWRQVVDSNFGVFLKYPRALREYKRMVTEPRMWEMEIVVIFGPTGVGKTRYVYDNNEPDTVYSLPPTKSSGCYWDGYDGQPIVLIDEMYGNRFSWGHLLMLCDRYPMKVPIHGGFVEFVSRTIYFTSNCPPEEWYRNVPTFAAFERRISKRIEFRKRTAPTVLVGDPASRQAAEELAGQIDVIVTERRNQ